MKKWLLSTLLIGMLWTTPTFAESLNITNTQYNPSTQILSGTTAPNATITLNGVSGSVLSDGDGQFTITIPKEFKHAELFVIDPEGNQKTTTIPIDNPNASANQEWNNSETNQISSTLNLEQNTNTTTDNVENTTEQLNTSNIQENTDTSKASNEKATSSSNKTQKTETSTTKNNTEKQYNTTAHDTQSEKDKTKTNTIETTKDSMIEHSKTEDTLSEQTKEIPHIPTWAWPVVLIAFILILFVYLLKRRR